MTATTASSKATATWPVPDDIRCTLTGLTATRPDGATATLDDCDWLHVGPCGCVSGITRAVCGTDAYLSADQVLVDLFESRAEARFKARAGWTAVLIHHADFSRITHIFEDRRRHAHPHYGETLKTRDVGGVTFTRHTAKRWTAADGWTLNRALGGWIVSSRRLIDGRYSHWAGRTLDDALKGAADRITAAT